MVLDASGSHDARGSRFTDRLGYLWQQVASDEPGAAVVPATADNTIGTVTAATAATATFTAPAAPGHYYVRLTAADSVTRQTATDVVRITVQG